MTKQVCHRQNENRCNLHYEMQIRTSAKKRISITPGQNKISHYTPAKMKWGVKRIKEKREITKIQTKTGFCGIKSDSQSDLTRTKFPITPNRNVQDACNGNM